MQCKKCGTEIKEGYLFCHNCAEAVQIVPDYDPELEALELETSEHKIPEIKQKTAEHLQIQKEGREHLPEKKKQTSFLKKWLWMIIAVSVVVGIAAFLIGYGIVLKHQEPHAMIEQETIKETPVPMRAQTPQFGIPGGEYSYYISVELIALEKGMIHYTLDGSTPDENASVYVKPIELSEGTTVVRAILVNEEGNCSDVISEVYTVEFGVPDAPIIIPDSGSYEGERYVRMIVPEGCMAYYTLDGTEPTTSSELYTGEFLMPEGKTIVRALLEDEKGNLSESSMVVYECVRSGGTI